MSGFPPSGPITRQSFIKSYLYEEYFDDDDLQAFNNSHNEGQQEVCDAFNALNLPIYTKLSGSLLDWVGTNLYGISRPALSLSKLKIRGPYNTHEYNTLAYGELRYDYGNGDLPVSDDIYKRILTWHYWRGDGRHISIPWLKRRIGRFLFGANGGDIPVGADLRQIGVLYSINGNVTITIVTGRRDVLHGPYNTFEYNDGTAYGENPTKLVPFRPTPDLAYLFQSAVSYGILEMPSQYIVYVNVGVYK